MNHQQHALVVKDNRLIESSYRLDLCEQRVMLMAIVEARSRKVIITPETWLEVSATDYAAMYEVDVSIAYKHLKLAADGLLSRQITLEGFLPETKQSAVLKTHWATHTLYISQIATIKIRLSDVVIPYVTNLESHFTSYRLKAVAGMGSAYAIRLYELLIQYQSIGRRCLSLVDLRRYLDAQEKSYDRVDNFKRKVIDIAVKQINECSDLSVEYQQIKQGRAVVALEFIIIVPKDHVQGSKAKPIQSPTPHQVSTQEPRFSAGLAGLELIMFNKLKKLDSSITESKVRKQAAEDNTSELLVIQDLIEQMSK